MTSTSAISHPAWKVGKSSVSAVRGDPVVQPEGAATGGSALGLEARHLYRNESFDVICSGLDMPRLNGEH